MPSVEHVTMDDPRLADYREARDVELRGSRFTERRFMVESETVLRRLLGSGFSVRSFLLSPARFESLREAIERHEPEAPVYLLDEADLRAHAGYRHHHGVLAIGARPDPALLSVERWLEYTSDRMEQPIIIAENVTHVDNLGALFRNAAAFGARGILLDPTCTDPFFRKTIRFSMGYVFRVPFAVARDWPGELDQIRETGARLIAVETGIGAGPAWMLPRDRPPAFIFGSEGRGLRAETLARCEHRCEIPMAEGVPSINVAAASAVMLYEWRRGGDEAG